MLLFLHQMFMMLSLSPEGVERERESKYKTVFGCNCMFRDIDISCYSTAVFCSLKNNGFELFLTTD